MSHESHLSLLHTDLPPVSQPELIPKSEPVKHPEPTLPEPRPDLFQHPHPPGPPGPDMSGHRLPTSDARVHMDQRMGLDLLAPRYQSLGDIRLPEPHRLGDARAMLPSSPSFLQPTSNSNLAILEQSRSLTTLSMPTPHTGYPIMSPHGFFGTVSPTSLTSSYLSTSPSTGLPSSFLYPPLYGSSGSSNQNVPQQPPTSTLPPQYGAQQGPADTRYDLMGPLTADRRSQQEMVGQRSRPLAAPEGTTNGTSRDDTNENKDNLGILTTRDPNATVSNPLSVSHHHDNGDSVWRPY